MKPPTALLFAFAVLISWRLKRFYADAPVDDLRWILDPTARLVTVVTGARFEWEPGQGYLSRERLFVIAKVCAGVNFMIAAFGMTAWMLARRVMSWASLAAVIVASLLAAYSTTVVVNAARISFAVRAARHPAGMGWLTAAQIHRVEGIVFYFGGLLLLYALLRRFERGSVMTPLAWYLSITIAIPLANGAASRERSLLEHTLFVVGIPLVLVAVVRVLTLHRFHDFFMSRLSSR